MSRVWLLSVLLLPALVACPGNLGDHGATGPSDNSMAFQFDGGNQTVAGSYGSSWRILTSPQVFSGSKLHLNGTGTIVDDNRVPLDLTRSDLPNEGYYIPPVTVPDGGITVYLTMESINPFTKQWESSSAYPIQVIKQTMPMIFRLGTNPDGSNSPSSITLGPGQTSDAVSGALCAWWIYIQPWPLNPEPHFQLSSSQPSGTDLGSVNLVRPLDGQNWTFNYTAPTVITIPYDVKIRAILHDPWFDLDPFVDFTVHLVPGS